MKNIDVKLLLAKGVQEPQYATAGAAGFDIAANADMEIKPGQTAIVPTGLSMEIPEGYELQIRPRSGTTLKTSARVANAPGTIDSDYRGEIGILVTNSEPVGLGRTLVIKKNERIAQGVFQDVIRAKFKVTEQLSETERGAGGFGSTGTTVDQLGVNEPVILTPETDATDDVS